jgi:hypothetical protein
MREAMALSILVASNSSKTPKRLFCVLSRRRGYRGGEAPAACRASRHICDAIQRRLDVLPEFNDLAPAILTVVIAR